MGAAIAIYWQLNRQPTLAQLQQKYLTAQNDSERARIIDQVEEYYLHLSVEDSIRKRVEQNVAAMVDTSRPGLSDFDGGWDSPDLYALESRLKQLLKAAMIVCAKSSREACAAFLQKAVERAAFVDSKTQHQYWTALVEKMKAYSKKAALAYLRAGEAAAWCARRIDRDYQAAEQSAALALQYLRSRRNERLRLELMQRIQYILFLFRNLNELSIALAEHNWPAAEKVGDYLRMTGILYNQAEAYGRGGEIENLLKQCQRIQNLAEEHKDISIISWYQIKAMIFTIEAYWRLGDFEKALIVVAQAEQLRLSPEEIVVLTNLKGLISQGLGNYEIAESEFKRALLLADSSAVLFNRIVFRINLADLYRNLTEYELASTYLNQATQLLYEYDVETSGEFVRVLFNSNLLEATTEKVQPLLTHKLIEQTKRILTGAQHSPNSESRLHFTLGRLYFALQEYQNALPAFQSAERICEQNGLISFAWEVKINAAKTLLHLREFDQARKKVNEVFLASREKKEYERMIDALAIRAEIERQKGDLNAAINITNQLINTVEELSGRFEQPHRLAAFRQKMYDYLKQAVLYEIYRNRVDSALIKLDYAKSRALKHFENFGNGDSRMPIPFVGKHLINIDSLKNNVGERKVVLDYFLSSDTLYMFVISRADSLLLKKQVDINDLKKNVYDLLKNINQTITLFKNYDPSNNRRHFIENTELAHSLFEKLMGLPELKAVLENVNMIYFVPDEFLYQVPFAALVVDTTKEAKYLVETAALAYLPAVSFLQPNSKISDGASLHSQRSLISANPDIPGVSELVNFLRKTFPLFEELQTNSPPTKQHIIEKLTAGHDVYIVVGHGSANPTEVERSQMEFTIKDEQNGSIVTIPLTIADLKQTTWFGAKMVMLVGCETGGGKVYRGAGMIGLQQWFAAMGAENVIGSQWKVDAAQTLDQIEHFIGVWLENDNPAKALQTVQSAAIQKLRQHDYFKFPHPYYWSANTLICKN